jgi:phosphatidate cytidylyltransferase
MNVLTPETKKKMLNRIVVGLILTALGVPAFLLGGWYIIGLVSIGLVLAIHEFTNAPPHNHYKLIIHLFIMLMTLSLVFWVFIKNNFEIHELNLAAWDFTTTLNQLEMSTTAIAVSVSVLFLSSILNKNFKIEDATYLNTMVILVGLSAQSLLFLRFYPILAFQEANITMPWWATSFLIAYVIIGTFSTDIGAYFVGITFGRNKINPRISPKKTWEGFFGGIFFSFVFSVLFAFVVDSSGYPLLPFLGFNQWYLIVFLSILIPLMANLGDFLFSAIKRHFGIKDFSTLLQEHGGILDRIGSLLLSSLFVAIFIPFIEMIWNLFA